MQQNTDRAEFARHKDFAVRVEQVGAERQTVVVIDNFLENAEYLVDAIAEDPGFSDQTGLYPGVRSPAPRPYMMALYNFLPAILEEAFGLSRDAFSRVESVYSMVTTPPEELSLLQRVPHFDSNNPNELAMIHFLCGPEHGGTSIYRHRDTGYEFVDRERRQPYIESVEAAIKESGEPPQAYINGDTDLYQRVESFDAAFNRLILYRCTTLHSGNIPADFGFDQNPRTGRLSLNTFLLQG